MKVIILCGGMGTRLREETEYKPKPMVEIGGRPIIWHIMKHYAHFGYKEFVLALGYKGDVIRDYFLNYHKYNSDFTVDLSNGGNTQIHRREAGNDWKVTLVETGANSMTGYRTKLCGAYCTESRFLLTYGDAVSNVDISQLVEFHKQQDSIATVTGVYPPSRFGDLETEGEIVAKFKEKQKDIASQNPINGGYFVFKKEFLDSIPDDPSCDLECGPMDKLTKMHQLSVYRHTDFWHCMDTYRDNQVLNKLWKENAPWKLWV